MRFCSRRRLTELWGMCGVVFLRVNWFTMAPGAKEIRESTRRSRWFSWSMRRTSLLLKVKFFLLGRPLQWRMRLSWMRLPLAKESVSGRMLRIIYQEELTFDYVFLFFSSCLIMTGTGVVLDICDFFFFMKPCVVWLRMEHAGNPSLGCPWGVCHPGECPPRWETSDDVPVKMYESTQQRVSLWHCTCIQGSLWTEDAAGSGRGHTLSPLPLGAALPRLHQPEALQRWGARTVPVL